MMLASLAHFMLFLNALESIELTTNPTPPADLKSDRKI